MWTKTIEIFLLLFLSTSLYGQQISTLKTRIETDSTGLSLHRFSPDLSIQNKASSETNPQIIVLEKSLYEKELLPQDSLILESIKDNPFFKQFHGNRFCIFPNLNEDARKIIPADPENMIQHLIVVNPFPSINKKERNIVIW